MLNGFEMTKNNFPEWLDSLEFLAALIETFFGETLDKIKVLILSGLKSK